MPIIWKKYNGSIFIFHYDTVISNKADIDFFRCFTVQIKGFRVINLKQSLFIAGSTFTSFIFLGSKSGHTAFTHMHLVFKLKITILF